MTIHTTWIIDGDTLTDALWGYRLRAPGIETAKDLMSGDECDQCWVGRVDGGVLSVWAIYAPEPAPSATWREDRRADLPLGPDAIEGEEPMAWLMSPGKVDSLSNRDGYALLPTAGSVCFELHLSAPAAVTDAAAFRGLFERLIGNLELVHAHPLVNVGTAPVTRTDGADPFDPVIHLGAANAFLHSERQYVMAAESFLAALVFDAVPAPRRLADVLALTSEFQFHRPEPMIETALRVDPGLTGHGLNLQQRWGAWHGLGLSFALAGEPVSAATLFERSLVVAEEADNREMVTAALYDLANARFLHGDRSGAADALARWVSTVDDAQAVEALRAKIGADADFSRFLSTADWDDLVSSSGGGEAR